MKKILSILTALALIVTVSCSKKTNSNDSNSMDIQMELISFKEVNIEMGEDFSRIISLDKSGDKLMIMGESETGEYLFYITNRDFKEHTDIEFTAKDGEEVQSACIDELGKITVLTVCDSETLLYTYGSDGVLIDEKNLGEVVYESEYEAMIYNTPDGYIINFGNENIAVIDNEMNYLADVNIGNRQISGCCKDANGLPTVIFNDGKICEVATIKDNQLDEIIECRDFDSTVLALCAGNSEYSIVGNFMDGMYGLDGGKWTKITNYSDNSFGAYNVLDILSLSNNEYVIINGNSLVLLSKREISELKSKKTVTLASFYAENTMYNDLIKKFNAQNDKYKIEVVAYEYDYKSDDISKIMQDREQKTQELKLDIITGKSPDLITDIIPGLDPSIYYYDLMEFLKCDPGLNTDDFIPGFLDGISFKGKIPVLFPTFKLNTFVGKTEFVGNKENISYDDIIRIYNSIPDDMKLIDSQNKMKMSDTFMSFVNYNDFVDFNTGECRFDSAEFIKMLKFIKDNHLGLNQSEFDNYIENISNASINDDSLEFRNNKAALYGELNSPKTAVETLHGVFDEPITFIGTPTMDGIGSSISPAKYTLSIMRSAKEPEGAWEFIKFALLNDEDLPYFSVLENKFKSQIEDTKNITHFENGKECPGGRYNYYFDPNTKEWSYIDYDSFTQEEADYLETYVRCSVKKMYWKDENIPPIIYEELEEYFNSDRSAEKTAEVIQNRMSIYMSENYG